MLSQSGGSIRGGSIRGGLIEVIQYMLKMFARMITLFVFIRIPESSIFWRKKILGPNLGQKIKQNPRGSIRGITVHPVQDGLLKNMNCCCPLGLDT